MNPNLPSCLLVCNSQVKQDIVGTKGQAVTVHGSDEKQEGWKQWLPGSIDHIDLYRTLPRLLELRRIKSHNWAPSWCFWPKLCWSQSRWVSRSRSFCSHTGSFLASLVKEARRITHIVWTIRRKDQGPTSVTSWLHFVKVAIAVANNINKWMFNDFHWGCESLWANIWCPQWMPSCNMRVAQRRRTHNHPKPLGVLLHPAEITNEIIATKGSCPSFKSRWTTPQLCK